VWFVNSWRKYIKKSIQSLSRILHTYMYIINSYCVKCWHVESVAFNNFSFYLGPLLYFFSLHVIYYVHIHIVGYSDTLDGVAALSLSVYCWDFMTCFKIVIVFLLTVQTNLGRWRRGSIKRAIGRVGIILLLIFSMKIRLFNQKLNLKLKKNIPIGKTLLGDCHFVGRVRLLKAHLLFVWALVYVFLHLAMVVINRVRTMSDDFMLYLYFAETMDSLTVLVLIL